LECQSISGLLKGKFNRVYTKDNYNWTNELIVRYGLNKQDGIELRKTEDVLQLSSALGYRKDTLSNWFHTAANSISLPNSQMDMRIQIRIFQYPDHLHPLIYSWDLERNMLQRQTRIAYLSPFTPK
jgi:hypothetical protein